MGPFVVQTYLLFQCWQPNFQKWLQNFKVAASKFNLDRPLTSMASKMARTNILKIASNHSKSFKYWWEVWVLGRGCKKTKGPQQWGVWDYIYIQFIQFTKETLALKVSFPYCVSAYLFTGKSIQFWMSVQSETSTH